MELNPSLPNSEFYLSEIRRRTIAKEKPSEILRFLARDGEGRGKIQMIYLFHRACETNLVKVQCIGGWWFEGQPEINDNQIDEYLEPILEAFRLKSKATSTDIP